MGLESRIGESLLCKATPLILGEASLAFCFGFLFCFFDEKKERTVRIKSNINMKVGIILVPMSMPEPLILQLCSYKWVEDSGYGENAAQGCQVNVKGVE